jgi:hypothetical protein
VCHRRWNAYGKLHGKGKGEVHFEMHNIGSLAALTSKALAKEVSDIRLIVNAQNTHAHDAASAMVAR